MKADREAFIEQIRILDRDALLSLVASLYDEMEETRLKYLENELISTEAHIQFSELNAKYTALLAENENLKKLLQKEVDKNTLKTRSAFGRKTEGFLSMLDAADNPEEEPVDESDTEDRKEEAPSVITSEDYGNLPGGDLAFGEDSAYSDSYDDQGYEQKTGGFVFGDSAQETYVPVEEPVQIPEEPAPAQEETEIPSEMLLEEEPAAEPEVIEITVPEEVIAQKEPVLKEEPVQEEPAPEASLPEEPVFEDEPEMGEASAPEEVQAPESAFEFPSQTEPSVSDREARRAEKKAQKEARRAEKQAEKEARRKAKLDEKFKTRTADPLKASDIDMVPEDDD